MRLTRVLFATPKLPKSWSNFPERYIKRSMEEIEYKTPVGRQYRRAVIKRPDSDFVYGLDRPWTDGFKKFNEPGKLNRPQIIEPVPELFFKGDRVQILVGKDKGKQGIVNYIVKERNWVCVSGLNCKHEISKNFEGKKIVQVIEQPLVMFEQVALVDPTDERACKAQWRYTENNERVRISLRSGREIPIPLTAEETYDYKTRNTYKNQPKDTSAADLVKITFLPKLATFEMDIMEEHGIKDDRIPAEFYWY
ncbi:probable 39S ribosomal protein L24, mitochondrial [Galendromus occidentalis]|uniref:Large ribosomal subunit protein uL24m n=1 Tax=Galendromus occidentalis TaxID=34638 RepID=A0AAJ6QX85_9ACAR|nr:probable 39S ribosomal protein L24, mitochondrial [Galendromus occidentalis]